MARTEKLSITLDSDVLAEMKKRARGEKKPLSTVINDTLAAEVRRECLRLAIEAFEKKHGVIREEEMAEVRAKLDMAWAKMQRRRRRRRLA